MGPRLASRGNPTEPGSEERHDALQWGRGSRAAETMQIPRLRATGRTLQWGRGSRAAETLSSLLTHGDPDALQWGRGSRAAETEMLALDRLRQQASMGPRLASRGNQTAATPGSQASRGFNGAAAREPRKRRTRRGSRGPSQTLQWGRGSRAAETRWACHMRPAALRFNGAAAREPRKPDHWVKGVGRCMASMGPRLASRGNDYGGVHWSTFPWLQWGRGSRAAETIDAGQRRGGLQASMGPRLASRGNARGVVICGPYPTASMGPRLASRGNCGLLLEERPAGLGFNGAAAREPRKP